MTLGVLPGGGGTQRLPRLIGASPAIALMTTGRIVDGGEALRLGIVDGCDADPVSSAAILARELAVGGKALVPVSLRAVALPANADPASFFDEETKTARASSKGSLAPERIVECVRAAATLPFEDGLAAERRAFEDLVDTSQAKALQHVFLAERAAGRIPDLPPATKARMVERVGIVGAGTMGSGIAMAFANAGYLVTVFDGSQEGLERGRSRIAETYSASVTRKRLARDEAELRLGRVTFASEVAAVASADLVIEAVFEDAAVKREVFRTLDALARPGAILATNTSFLDIDALAGETARPQDVIGLHFFSPANVMRLLEVVCGGRTALDVLRTALDVAKRIGKVAVVSRNGDGFIGNRMIERYVTRAYELVAEGASPRQVDTALETFGMAMGPFAMSDLAGNDISWLDRKRRVAADPAYR